MCGDSLFMSLAVFLLTSVVRRTDSYEARCDDYENFRAFKSRAFHEQALGHILTWDCGTRALRPNGDRLSATSTSTSVASSCRFHKPQVVIRDT